MKNLLQVITLSGALAVTGGNFARATEASPVDETAGLKAAVEQVRTLPTNQQTDLFMNNETGEVVRVSPQGDVAPVQAQDLQAIGVNPINEFMLRGGGGHGGGFGGGHGGWHGGHGGGWHGDHDGGWFGGRRGWWGGVYEPYYPGYPYCDYRVYNPIFCPAY